MKEVNFSQEATLHSMDFFLLRCYAKKYYIEVFETKNGVKTLKSDTSRQFFTE